jgi:hypothetical protein
MSARFRAASTSPPLLAALPAARPLPAWLVAVAAVTLLLPMILVHASRAEPAPVNSTLDPETTRRLGLEVDAKREVVGGQLLVSIGAGDARSSEALSALPDLRLLAAAPDATRVALADRLGREPAQLLISQPDGGVSITALPGLLDAAFAPDGSWLAAVDGAGGLWRVGATDGAAAPIADGPFAGSVEFAADGRLLLLSVSSVDAPTFSTPVLIDPQSGDLESLLVAQDSLVYRARLTDRGLAVVAHLADGTKEIRLSGPASRLLGVLPSDAGSADVSADLRWAAYQVASKGLVLVNLDGGATQAFAVNGRPAFAPNATSLLVRSGDRVAVVDLATRQVTSLDGQAVWARCAEGCQP